MFKNAAIYRILSMPQDLGAVERALEVAQFVPCGASQEKSVGWVPPRGHEHDALVESVAGQWLLKLKVETKAVPADVVKRKVAEQVEQMEAQTGRKPGKKEMREITEDARLALLPMAFTKIATTLVWISPKARLLVIDSGSQSRIDEVVTWLVKALDGLTLQIVQTNTSPASAMAGWLATKDAPPDFTVDRECELKASDESQAVVKYGRHALDIDEVAQHIAQGKIPTRLALTYSDRVSFVLTDGGLLKKIAFLDAVVSDHAEEEHADNFDADAAITTGELGKLFPALFTALGGEASTQAKVDNSSTPGARLDALLKRDGLTATVEDNKDKVLATLGYPLDGEPDPMYADAVAVVRKHKKPSISLVQRHLKIGYNRAARLLESMEKAKVVSPMKSNGQREILALG